MSSASGKKRDLAKHIAALRLRIAQGDASSREIRLMHFGF